MPQAMPLLTHSSCNVSYTGTTSSPIGRSEGPNGLRQKASGHVSPHIHRIQRIQLRMHRVQLQAPLAEAKAQRIESANAIGYASPHQFIAFIM
jgi:hypothetical protein